MVDPPHIQANPQPALVIFDDERGRFGPMTDRRPCFALRMGPTTNRVRIETALGRMACGLIVAPRLLEARRERETDALNNPPMRRDSAITFHVHDKDQWRPVTVPGDADVLLVNGRWTGGPPLDPKLIADLPTGSALVQPDGQVIAARLACDEAQQFVDSGFARLAATRITAPVNVLLDRPWHLLDQLEATLAFDLAGVQQRIAGSARVHPTAVLDDSGGPVVVADEAVVGPLAVVEGPCYIGRGSVVQPHSYIRPHTVIGEACKVAGEISFSVIHGHTNKAHYGYLGHALVGEWVNLGAGTTASNLKNTYGEVRVQVGDAPEGTGRTSQGPILGDFVRTAIGTLIPTGACIGTGCMIAEVEFAPKYARAGGFYTDVGRAAYDADKLVATANAMMSRRGMALSAAEERLLRSIVAGAAEADGG